MLHSKLIAVAALVRAVFFLQILFFVALILSAPVGMIVIFPVILYFSYQIVQLSGQALRISSREEESKSSRGGGGSTASF